MFVFFILLLIVTWITAYRQWDDMYDCPVACVPRGIGELGGRPLGWAIATTIFLVGGYSAWAMQLGEWILDQDYTIRRRTRVELANLDDALLKRLGSFPILLKICRGIGMVAVWWRFYYFSEATDIVTVLGWFIANCVWTVQDKIEGYDVLSPAEWRKENEMEFGQIVPLVLLMLPLMGFIETYHGELYCVIP